MMGDEEFDAFFSVSYSRLVGQLYAMTGDWAGAQELVLEAFVRAWDHRSQFDLVAAPDSWIRTVAWHLAGSRRRREREAAGDGAPAGAERVTFVEALRRLGEDQRCAAVLHYLCDLGIEEIAAETGVAVEAVAMGLARARAALACVSTGAFKSGVFRPLIATRRPIGTTSRPPRITGGSGEICASSFRSSSRLCRRPWRLSARLRASPEFNLALGLPACSCVFNCSAR